MNSVAPRQTIVEDLEVIPVTAGANLVALPENGGILVGAPPEALKVTLLWEWPTPSVVVLPSDPLYAYGVNQASFEFLLYNHLFQMEGLRRHRPFQIVCDGEQYARIWRLVRSFLRGPSDAEMAAFGEPALHRQQLRRELEFVSRPVSQMPLDEMVRVLPFENGVVELLDGTIIESLPGGECRIVNQRHAAVVARAPDGRGTLPFLFPEPPEPVRGSRFGLHVIGSASGFSAADWSSCFLVWINGMPLIVDGTPYLDEHLQALGIEEDHVLGYLITHNHEDHANAIGQLVNRRRVTVLTSPAVMAGLVLRLSVILDRPEDDVRGLIDWVRLDPGLEAPGEPRHWYGAEIRTWYSVHTIPTLGVEVRHGDHLIRLTGDTMWGRQLAPLLENGVISQARHDLIQRSYRDADLVIADAGGGAIHPDPDEVLELVAAGESGRVMVTHITEDTRDVLPNAEPGESVVLEALPARQPGDVQALFSSPLFRDVPERWLTALLYGGEIVSLPDGDELQTDAAAIVLAGQVACWHDRERAFLLERGDLYDPRLLAETSDDAVLSSEADWTRLLLVPAPLFAEFLQATGLERRFRQLHTARTWWQQFTDADLTLPTLLALAQVARARRYAAGETIVAQGAPATRLYLVTEGEVESIREQHAHATLVQRHGPGFAFGVIGLFEGCPLQQTLRARTDVRLLTLSSQAFEDHLMRVPLVHYYLGLARDERVARLRAGELPEGEA